MSWPAVAGDDTAGYRVFRSATVNGTFTQLGGTLTGTSYADTTAPAGARSQYQVRAVDTSGNLSPVVSADALRPEPVPAQVLGVAASGSPAGVALTWTAATAPTATGYHVYSSTSATGSYARLTTAPITAPRYDDTTAPAGATSYYQVTAVNATGESPRSASVSALRPGGTQAPIRINAGGPAQTVSGTTWSACSAIGSCSGWVSGGNACSEADTITGIPAGVDNTILQSEWTGGAFSPTVPVGQRAFGFSVPVANGAYQVRLHFAELNKTGANQRTFDVRLEGSTVLSNFDVFQQAGGIDRAIVRQFNATVTDGAVTIDFIRRIENAEVSAIEIVPLG